MTVLQSPTLADLAEFIEQAHAEGDLITIYATCRVEYSGNREGEIGDGDRIIICKQDGAVAVHRPTGARAVARQGTRSSLETVLQDDIVRLYSGKGRSERIRVDITDVSVAIRDNAVDNATLRENQTEKQMHEYILSNPEAIEPGLRLIDHERSTPRGRMDFVAADADGDSVILEIKQPVAKHPHVDQLRRYVSYFQDSDETVVRGILVAPEIGGRVKRLLRDHGLEWKELDEYRLSETPPSQTSFEEWS